MLLEIRVHPTAPFVFWPRVTCPSRDVRGYEGNASELLVHNVRDGHAVFRGALAEVEEERFDGDRRIVAVLRLRGIIKRTPA